MNSSGTSQAILRHWNFGKKSEPYFTQKVGSLFSPKFYRDFYTISTEEEFLQFSQKYLKKLFYSSIISFYVWDETAGHFEPKIFSEPLSYILSYQIEEGIVEWLFNEDEIIFLRPEKQLNLFSNPLHGKLLVLFPLKILGESLGFFGIATRRFRSETLQEKKAQLQILQALFSGLFGAIRSNMRVQKVKKINHQIESQMFQSGKLIALGELVGGVAHEINNPMTTILGRLQIMKIKNNIPDAIREKLEIVESEAKRVSEIVKDLLNFARNNQERNNSEIVNINSVIQKSLDLIRHNLEVEGIEISLNLDSSVRHFIGNTNQWLQVFVNLFVNAQQALQRGGHIFVETHQKEREQVIRFRDDGPGIPEEIQPRIFESFYTTRAGRGGTGLGLSITKKIVETHGGTISVKSAKGRGTEFEIRVPTEKEEEN